MTGYLERSLAKQRVDDQRFIRWVGASLGLHLLMVLVVGTWQYLQPREALIKRPDAIEVLLVSMAPGETEGRKTRRLPDKETFVPVKAPSETEAPEEAIPKIETPRAETPTRPEQPVPPVVKEPSKTEPPREAKTLPEAIKKDTPVTDSGVDEEARRALAALVERQKEAQERRVAIAKLSGSPGLKDRTAGSGAGSGSGAGEGMGGNALSVDPAWARALNEVITPLWLVIPTLSNKDLRVSVHVTVDAEGNVRDAVVETSSGELSLDSSGVRAVKKASILPLPSKPELRSSVLADGFSLVFNPKGLAQ